MQTSVSYKSKFDKDMTFQVDINYDQLIDIVVQKQADIVDLIINLTKDQYLGLLDFLQSVAIEKLERPY